MATNRKNTAPRRRVSSGKQSGRNPGAQPAPVSLWKRLRQMPWREKLSETFRGENGRFIVGIFVLGISLFLLISIVSNYFTGSADQAGVQAGTLDHAANYGGKLGAYVSYYFMDGCFGVTSVFIPVFAILVAVKLMGAYSVRLWKWFANFTIIMLWGSLFFSLVTRMLPDSLVNQLSFRLGGSHGDYIRDYLVNTLGTAGAWIVTVAVAVFYLMYLTGETVNVVRRLMHPQDFIKDRLGRRSDDSQAEGNGLDDEALDDLEDYDDEDERAGDDEDEAGEEAGDAPEGDDEGGPHIGEAPTDDQLTANDEDTHEGQAHTISLDVMPGTPSKSAPAQTGEAKLQIETTPHDDKALDITAPVNNDKASGKTVEEVLAQEPYDPRKDLEYYKFPEISLLKHYADNGPAIDMAEQNANKDRIITVLRSFGVEIDSIKATIGPTITLYEVTPAPGVRINRIRNLEDDIALSLSAIGIRIIAPMPGKGTIGIEVPNKVPRIVSMESIINTKKFQDSTYELPIALGKTITNEVFMVDLAKMPHLLVAGATGQGKSVGLNAIITSLLYKKHPSELKFVMVDPKKVEFSIYSPIERHFLAKIPDGDDPIITDVTKVVQTLKSLCQLMDHRYDLLKKAKVRNIKEYNAKFKARMLNPNNGHEYMPYIVVIIDEFGDLIMTAGKEVELPIARIAQLARAVGMHMVIATQRPTTNIITGTIKANFPARMAFKVMSQIDSRTILDQGGANQLVGKGDMLFLAGNTPTRVQCAFVDTPEVERINEYIADQQGYLSAYELPEPEMDDEGAGSKGDLDASALDPMFEEAARLIVVHQQGSTSLIQRKFSIGYNRAGRLMDQLERAGIVGPTRGAKPREVLCSDEVELDARIASLRNG